MKKKSKDILYIPHQDIWNEHFPKPGKPKHNFNSDPNCQYNKLLRQQLKNKQK